MSERLIRAFRSSCVGSQIKKMVGKVVFCLRKRHAMHDSIEVMLGGGKRRRGENNQEYLLFMCLFSHSLERHTNVKRRLDTCRGQI